MVRERGGPDRATQRKRQDLSGWKGKDERIGELGRAVDIVKIGNYLLFMKVQRRGL